MNKIQVGRIILAITQISGDNGLRVPAELTMLGKTLLNLDLVGQTLDPEFDPTASIRRNAEKIMQQRLWKALSPTKLFGGLLDVQGLSAFAGSWPSRMHLIAAAPNWPTQYPARC